MGKGKRPKPPAPVSRRTSCPPRGGLVKFENQIPEAGRSSQAEKLEVPYKNPVGTRIDRRKSVEMQSDQQPGPSRLSKPFQVIFNYIPSPSTQPPPNNRRGNFPFSPPPPGMANLENDPLFIETPEPIEEDPPQEILPDSGEYVEELVYVDLDEIPNIQELFSIRPDDHLLLQNTRQREKPVVPKPTVSDVTLKFYNLESDKPVLRLGKTFFTGRWIDSVGSSLFFNKRDKGSSKIRKDFEFVHLLTEGKTKLNNLIPEKPKISLDAVKPDPVFREKESLTPYDLCANVKKILKLTRRDLSGAESSSSSRVIHDDARFMPSFYIDKEMRNKVEILQLLGKHRAKDFKFKWELQKGTDKNTPTEIKRRERNDESEWEDLSESDLSEDEGSSSSCDDVDEEAYEAYLKIREELNYETKNFNFNNKKTKVVETSESFKERYSAPYYLNRKRVVSRVNSMLSRANMKKINYVPPNYKRKRVPLPAENTSPSKDEISEQSVGKEPTSQNTNVSDSLSSEAIQKNKNERFYKPTFRSKEELSQKSRPLFNANSSLKSTTTRVVLSDRLKQLIGETNVGDQESENEKTAEASELLKSMTVSESRESS